MKTKIIYTQALTIALFERGFEPIEMKQNPVRPEFNCWVFEDTPALQEALSQIMAERNGGSANGR